jgi:hypothetical protein
MDFLAIIIENIWLVYTCSEKVILFSEFTEFAMGIVHMRKEPTVSS